MPSFRILFLTAAALLLPLFVQAEIIGVDQFDYGPSSVEVGGQSVGFGWDFDNVTTGNPRTGTSSDWDSLSGGASFENGQMVTQNATLLRQYNGPVAGLPPSDEANGAFNDQSQRKAVYYRVDVSITDTTGSFGLLSYDFGDSRIFFGKSLGESNFRIVLLGAESIDSAIPVEAGRTYTLVAKIDYANDLLALYVDPDLNLAEDFVTPDATLAFTRAEWSTAVALTSFATTAVWDDLVVATEWDELGTIVTHTGDEDDGNATQSPDNSQISLREAINHAPDGGLIEFAPSLSGKTLKLENGQLEITKSLSIDASTLATGFTIDANGAVTNHRVMEIQPHSTVDLHGLTLTGGKATGSFPNDRGGAIHADGSGSGNSLRLSLSACTLSGNSASIGGGIFSNGSNDGNASVSLSACTLAGNSAAIRGGAIFSDGILGSVSISLSACTLSGNSAGFSGGGIDSNGSSDGSASVSLDNSILAGNNAPNGPDLWQVESTTTATGNNLISSLDGQSSLSADTPGLIVGDPRLAPLAYFGGPTMTMHPLAGSPAILSEQSTITRTDQRGFTLTGPPTIGAVMQGEVFNVEDLTDLSIALSAANTTGRVIRFVPSLNGQTFTLAHWLNIPSNSDGLFVDASSLPNGLTIEATESVVMIIRTNATVALHSLTLTGGRASGPSSGGAIYATGSGNGNFLRLSLFSCTLFDNYASRFGGAIYSSGSSGGCVSLSLFACTLSGNFAGSRGGGIYSNGSNGGSASLSLSECTLSGNSARSFDELIFDELNSFGRGPGGGIYSDGSNGGSASLSLSACTLYGNSADRGGGIHSNGAGSGSESLSLSKCTLYGNSASSSGGGIYSYGISSASVSLRLSECTLYGNSASFGGGGIYTGARTGISLSLENSIVAGNNARIGSDVLEALITTVATGNNLISSLDGQSSLSVDTPGLIVADPRLAPLGDYGGPTMTMLPLPGSPAIDAAIASTARFDQRGFERPLDGDNNGEAYSDIGAVEAPNYEALRPIELDALWPHDLDGDGYAYGLERSIGTQPFAGGFDANRLLSRPERFEEEGVDFALIRFGYNRKAPEGSEIRILRSTTLDPDSFEIIFRAFPNETVDFVESDPNNQFVFDPVEGFFRDANPPSPQVFYRLESEYTIPSE